VRAAAAAAEEALARRRLPPELFAYVAGGAGGGQAVRRNRAAFERRTLKAEEGGPTVRVDSVDTAAELLGMRLSMPLLIAPLAYQSLLRPEAERAMLEAVRSTGSAACVPLFGSIGIEEIEGGFRDASWLLQTYPLKDAQLQGAIVERAAAAGAEAVVLTVDPPRSRSGGFLALPLPSGISLPLLGLRTRSPRTPEELLGLVDERQPWQAVSELAAGSLPVVVKGVATPASAREALGRGAAAVVVSNHGGRSPASLDLLGPVAEAVAGEAGVWVDGGVRSGGDAAVALASGADAVLVGRPLLWALAAGGRRAVTATLRRLREELATAVGAAGCTDIQSLCPALLAEGA
jgi:4-hydroxymandelate oxidase